MGSTHNARPVIGFASAMLVALLGILGLVGSAHAQVSYEVLYSFGTDGVGPYAGLLQGTDGNFYGTTQSGGGGSSNCSGACGTVFKLDGTTHAVTTLHSFGDDGIYPFAGLLQGTDGNFYGTTYFQGDQGGVAVGYGTVFQMDGTTHAVSTLHSFTGTGTDGGAPSAGLIQGSDGNFYGTTGLGGASCCGTVFKLDGTTHALTTLHSFTGTDGSDPQAGLLQGSDGNYYGTTFGGGAACCGTVFKLDGTTHALTTLHSFTGTGTDGAAPFAGLIQGSDGNFYGTTSGGGGSSNCSFGCGTVFKLDGTTHALTTLHSFTHTGTDGANPYAGLIQGSDGNFYGTTHDGGGSSNCSIGSGGCGTVFKLDGTTHAVTTLHSFTGTDGANPTAALVQGSDGNLYGTTYYGGSSQDPDSIPNAGVVFVLRLGSASQAPTLALSLNQTSFHSGIHLALSATVTPGPTPVTADVYVAVQLPDASYLFLHGDGSISPDAQPLVTSWPISAYTGPVFGYTFGGGEPAGSYAWKAAFTQPGTMNFIGPIVSAPFTFSP